MRISAPIASFAIALALSVTLPCSAGAQWLQRGAAEAGAEPGAERVDEADWGAARAAAPRQLRIASGPLGHTYDRIYAVNILRLIEGYKGFAQRTGGSAANLELLARGQAEIGFSQADVYAASARRTTEIQDLLVLGSLAPECVYIAYRKDAPVQRLDDLRGQPDGRAPSVAVGPPGGGANGTWRNLAFLDPTLATAETHEIGGSLALNQLALGRFDAVVWVTDPRNWRHPNLRIVHQNANLGLMAVDDPELELEMRDGIQMYALRTVTTSPGLFNSGTFGSKLRTLCTETLVVGRPDASPSLLTAVADMVGLHGEWLSRRHVELR